KTPRAARCARGLADACWLLEPSDEVDAVARAIVHAAYRVHYELGPGLLEGVYEVCFCHELEKAGLRVRRQVEVPIVYDGRRFENGLTLDVLVEERIVCELKAVERIAPVHRAQLLSYLRLTGHPLGFLINFHVALIKRGIHRLVLET
ncbi:MAG: GxxExxY protein, partial [Polyangiaceae bacterium]